MTYLNIRKKFIKRLYCQFSDFTLHLIIITMIIYMALLLCTGCSQDEGTQSIENNNKAAEVSVEKEKIAHQDETENIADENESKKIVNGDNITGITTSETPVLPEGIKWLTNDTDPLFSSPDAVKGGILRTAIMSFPMTFRTVGPDSNGSFRSAILDNQLSLINLHPDTENIIPELATHWAFDADKKTMYFKLNREAKWSDGVPVTARDYAYTLEFMRSEHIIAPWYNDYYTKEIDSVIIYDDYTIAVKSTKAQPDLYLRVGIGPVPAHFFGTLNSDFVNNYNWKIVPNTGAYQMDDFKKGKHVHFKRKQNWWGENLRYFKNRFNVDRVHFTVVRDYNMLWEYFKKGEIDTFSLTMPQYWYEKADTDVFKNGYVEKIWFFNDTQQSAMGLWLNQDKEIFADKRLRLAFAHAMNVQKVIDQVLRGDYFRLNQAYVGYGAYTNPDITSRDFNIETVEKLMTESGWQRGGDGIWAKEGMRFSVEVTYGFDEHTPRLVVLKEEALKAGIELRLQKLDSTAAFKKFLEKKHDVAWMGWSTSLRPSYWQSWHSDNAHKVQTNNITNTDDPELDRLIDAYRASLDEDERIELSIKIQAAIHDQAAFVPTFMVPYVRHGYWRWLKLPKFHGTRKSDSLFDPFSSMTGGLFWFDMSIYKETKEAMSSNKTFDAITVVDERYK
ncbi:extracellular solute-binding protein [Desulfamplus magnetovallimortis]|nr:extracellular solute-binding protein [Desulfamplus magnetovallimortis]